MKLLRLLFIISITSNSGLSQTNWNDYISLYRNYGSPLVGGNCQMYPSCSKYADLQFKTFGFSKAFINTADRLIRCSHDINYYSLSKLNRNYKFIDFGIDSLNKVNKEVWNKGVYAYSENSEEYQLIKHLINQEHYHEALLEINRILFYNSHENLSSEIYVNYLRILRKLNQQQRIQIDFEQIVPAKFKSNKNILFEVGLSWIELENYNKSKGYFDEIIINKEDDLDITYQQSLVYKTYLETMLGNFKSANFHNQLLNENSIFGKSKITNNAIIKEIEGFKPKSKTTAAFLGIIPGAGYLYSGHSKSAFSSLIVNSLLVFATTSTIKSQNIGLGTLLAIITTGFYIGNIKGGSLSAERYNKNYIDNRLQKLYPNFSL